MANDDMSAPTEFSVADDDHGQQVARSSQAYLSADIICEQQPQSEMVNVSNYGKQISVSSVRYSNSSSIDFASVEMVHDNQTTSAQARTAIECRNCGRRRQKLLCVSCVQITTNVTLKTLQYEERSSVRDRLLAQFIDHHESEQNEQINDVDKQLGKKQQLMAALRLLVTERRRANQQKNMALIELKHQRQKKLRRIAAFRKWIEGSLCTEVQRHEHHLSTNQQKLCDKQLILLQHRIRLATHLLTNIFPIEECSSSREQQRRVIVTEAALNDALRTEFIGGKWVTAGGADNVTMRDYKINGCLLPSWSRLPLIRDQLFNSFVGSNIMSMSVSRTTEHNSSTAQTITALSHLLQCTNTLATCFDLYLPYKITHHNVLLDISNGHQFDTLVLQSIVNVTCVCCVLLNHHKQIDPHQPLANLKLLLNSLGDIRPDYATNIMSFQQKMQDIFEKDRKMVIWELTEFKDSHKHRHQQAQNQLNMNYFNNQSVNHNNGSIETASEDWEEVAMQDLPAAPLSLNSNMSASVLGDLMSSATQSVLGRLFQR